MFSYSIYLIHPAGSAIWSHWHANPSLGSGVEWIVAVAFMLATALLFYFLVERPSHQFARLAHMWLRQRSVTAVVE